jgi:hypothetical protein
MSENIYFQSGDIEISQNLARFGSKSFAVANIGSVDTKKIGPGARAPIGGLIALGGLIYMATTSTVIGLVVAAIGAAIYYFAKPKTALVLRTSSGDVQALESTDHKQIQDIKTAIERAFVSRK